VILVDANVLLYAYHRESAHHEVAREWVESAFSQTESIGLSWGTITAFLRLSTHPRIFTHPLTIERATAIVQSWIAVPVVTIVTPGPRHWEILHGLLLGAQARANLVPDAHLAALAIEHGAELLSNDRDFMRFSKLRFLPFPLG
jgi:hypothetical protein